ncbi:MAG: C4-type zinc ribbon domain-containing protein [Planctomycetes bacterium]|nr:C4-type zinc ribbon domain-containing protein [Planctomycetota bacterium]
MQDTIRALRALQELDTDIYRLKAELKRLPEERAKRRKELDQQIARCESQQKHARELRTKVKEIEDQTSKERQRIRKLETEAASSRGDVALLAAFQHEIKTLKRDISGAEEQGLELVGQAELAETDAKNQRAAIDEAEKVFAEFLGNVERETKEAQTKLERLLAERRQRMAKDLAPESLALYERLLAAREGVALALLDGRICQACFMEVPTNLYVRVARAAQLTQCPSCDRILFQDLG